MVRVPSPVDVDDQATWPDELRQLAERHAQQLAGSEADSRDGALIGVEDSFRSHLGRPGLLVFHCTRLLDHEREAIRSSGLHRVSEQLTTHRIESAFGSGGLTAAQRKHALVTNIYATGDPTRLYRDGQICFVVGQSIFDEEPHGCVPLLSTWGGEATRGGPSQDGTVRCGTPTIIAARISMDSGGRAYPMFPSLGELLVARCLGLAYRRQADYFHRTSDVPAADVLDMWQPGDPDYDRHERLPRSQCGFSH